MASNPRKFGSDIGFMLLMMLLMLLMLILMLSLWHKENMVKVLKRIINMYVFDFSAFGDNEFQSGNFHILSKYRNKCFRNMLFINVYYSVYF